MKYTKEELQNTYGEVQSLEHAEYIAELCESNGIELFNFYVEGITHFAINRGEIIFTYGKPAISGHDKEITIPLPPKESVIEWKEGAVCFAGGRQWHFNDSVKPYKLVNNMQGTRLESYVGVINMPDFQLNTIKQRDSIKASELDTEQKYDDVVKEFELFGYERSVGYNALGLYDFCFIAKNGHIGGCSERHLLSVSHRKITFNQLMAIGELKRLELKGGNATLSSDEETELKSRAMASELNSQSNDYEWPKVGVEATHSVYGLCKVMSLADSNGVVAVLNESGFNVLVFNSDLSKPKTPEDLLIEELQTKLVKNNAVDNWMLAANIISGDIEGLTYKSDIESAVKSVINKNLDGDL